MQPYSPKRLTGLVFTGTGTAGAYHAGVLRALHEAGIKIDSVAGHGMGAVSALFAAIDGGAHLWGDKGYWRGADVRRLYSWRATLQAAVWIAAFAVLIVLVPLAALAIGLVVYPLDFLLKMTGAAGLGDLVAGYLRLTETAFAPEGLPTWLPRLVFLVLATSVLLALAGGVAIRSRRHERGAFWWRSLASPLSASEAMARCWRVLWDLVRGATRLTQPSPGELAKRYTELLADNLGQPGFRDLLLAVHDLDARRDLIFALVPESRRRALIRRTTTEASEDRRAEVFDLAGVSRDRLVDAVAGALAVPLLCEPHAVEFPADGYWRGETHRLCDRPSCLARLIDELRVYGVEQVIVVSPAPETGGPHTLAAPRLDMRGRAGEYLRSNETALMRDAAATAEQSGMSLYLIRPVHNPIGPFDFAGGFDDRSDRRQPVGELIARGYEDCYRQFIEPVIGASGDQVGLQA